MESPFGTFKCTEPPLESPFGTFKCTELPLADTVGLDCVHDCATGTTVPSWMQGARSAGATWFFLIWAGPFVYVPRFRSAWDSGSRGDSSFMMPYAAACCASFRSRSLAQGVTRTPSFVSASGQSSKGMPSCIPSTSLGAVDAGTSRSGSPSLDEDTRSGFSGTTSACLGPFTGPSGVRRFAEREVGAARPGPMAVPCDIAFTTTDCRTSESSLTMSCTASRLN